MLCIRKHADLSGVILGPPLDALSTHLLLMKIISFQRAGVPLFFITNKQEEVQLQMYLLDFITRLIPEKSGCL